MAMKASADLFTQQEPVREYWNDCMGCGEYAPLQEIPNPRSPKWSWMRKCSKCMSRNGSVQKREYKPFSEFLNGAAKPKKTTRKKATVRTKKNSIQEQIDKLTEARAKLLSIPSGTRTPQENKEIRRLYDKRKILKRKLK